MSFMRNFTRGNHTPLERVRMAASNTLRKIVRRQACCGNYGDPGC